MMLVIAALLTAYAAARGSAPSKEVQGHIATMAVDGDIIVGCDGCGCEFCCIHSCSSRCGAPKECETIGCSFCQCAVAQCIDLIMEEPKRDVCLPSAFTSTVTVLDSGKVTEDAAAYIIRRSGSLEREDTFDQAWGTGDRHAATIIRDLDAGKEHVITYDGHDKATSCVQRVATASVLPKCLAFNADVEGSSIIGGSLKRKISDIHVQVETLRQITAPFARSEVQVSADTATPVRWTTISKEGFKAVDFMNFKVDDVADATFQLPSLCSA